MDQDNRTRAQRYSDNVAEFCGSWGFVFWFSAIILVWMLINTYKIIVEPFDRYPYILLNLFLTVISTMQSPIIMMSQNRQADREREKAEQDRERSIEINSKLDKLLERT